MKRKLILTTLLSLSTLSSEIPKEIEDLAKVIVISTNDPSLQEPIEEKVKCNPSEAVSKIEDKPTVILKGEGAWKVKVQYSVTMPKSKRLEKEFITDHNTNEVNSKLNTIIYGKFDSYEDRREAIKKMCEGTSFQEKLRLGGALGGRLASIYDYNRAGSSGGAVVKPEEQWQGLRAGKASGVCRDASTTIAHFLSSCGIPSSQMRIDSYDTLDAGHQVTSIYDNEGNLYTINWRELYSNKDNGVFATSVHPDIVNTGLYHQVYDSETGDVLDVGISQLGDVLKLAAGGKSDKPAYIPDELKIELAYNNWNINMFKTQTDIGEEVQGGGIYYRSGDPQESVYMSAGIAYAESTREETLNRDLTEVLKQNIVFVSFDNHIAPNFTVAKVGDTEFIFKPKIATDMDVYMADSELGISKGKSEGKRMSGSLGAGAIIKNDNITAWMNASQTYNYLDHAKNTEKDGEKDSGIVPIRTLYDAGVRYEGDRFTVEGYGSVISSKIARDTQLGIRGNDGNSMIDGDVSYIVYNRNNVPDRKFVVAKVGKSWSSIRVEVIAQKDLTFDDDSIGLNLSGRFGK